MNFELIHQVNALLQEKGVEKTLEILIAAIDIQAKENQEIMVQKSFYENLAMELIKEKQQRIRDEKGVFYYNGGMVVADGNIATLEPDYSRCEGCICSTCEKDDCTGCRFEAERCEECVDLEEDVEL